ncbi:MAG: hypothetical protein COZ43_13055 [Sphingomonadales bacterium CG_4_10_14_3_um_filter_58_15]|nr:MAG: hypothetical protein COZ43_13055 [Sphingomonadales bacterium CG_4_10_14_3_um_filter_58_15]
MLYIYLMSSIESVSEQESPADGASTTRLPVSGVNAHLRLIPRDPGAFRVVVTFHQGDGSLCEAELQPVEAAGLMSEIAHVIDQGNSRDPNVSSNTKREALDD